MTNFIELPGDHWVNMALVTDIRIEQSKFDPNKWCASLYNGEDRVAGSSTHKSREDAVEAAAKHVEQAKENDWGQKDAMARFVAVANCWVNLDFVARVLVEKKASSIKDAWCASLVNSEGKHIAGVQCGSETDARKKAESIVEQANGPPFS